VDGGGGATYGGDDSGVATIETDIARGRWPRRWDVALGERIPLRVMHCPTCATGIVLRDHHCVWIGRCVGTGNMAEFLFFIVSAVAISALVAAQAAVSLAAMCFDPRATTWREILVRAALLCAVVAAALGAHAPRSPPARSRARAPLGPPLSRAHALARSLAPQPAGYSLGVGVWASYNFGIGTYVCLSAWAGGETSLERLRKRGDPRLSATIEAERWAAQPGARLAQRVSCWWANVQYVAGYGIGRTSRRKVQL
jgi:hypothetical protein